MGIGKGIRSAFGAVFGVKTIKQQASYIKSDAKRIKQDFSVVTASLRAKNELIDEWSRFVSEHGITTEHLKKQYFFRSLSAYILLIAMTFCVYLILGREHSSAALAGLLVAGVLYFRNSVRLYQIRHRTLCTVKSYLSHATSSFKELFPLRLSGDWRALEENVITESGEEDGL